ncbi:MAG: UvrD-helicase domain-containing protein [Dysosmobacter sp.]
MSGGRQRPRSWGRQVAARYREILVDEYQDTNEVQNAIFQAVSRDGQNIFTVGDVKQSIYRFRLADPTIFLDKYHRLPSCGERGGWGGAQNSAVQKLPLPSERFWTRRTSSSPTSSRRRWERWTMERTRRLHFGAEYYPERRKDCDTEFHLIYRSSEVGGRTTSPVKRLAAEARFVAQRIRQLLDEGYPVTGGGWDAAALPAGGHRDLDALSRQPVRRLCPRRWRSGRCPAPLRKAAISFRPRRSLCTLALLEIVDNPRQDVPLIAVLRSPVFGFTPDRLAEIRASRDRRAISMTRWLADSGDGLQEFLTTL